MIEFRMPSLGADMDAGTLVAWRVARGQAVARGQIIALVETDKGVVEIESWQPGVVAELVVAVGAKVPVGTVLATLHGAEGPTAPPPSTPAPPAPVPAPPEATSASPTPQGDRSVTDAPSARAHASPAARRRARELGVDLLTQHGTGPHGAITVADVERAATTPAPEAPAPAPPAPEAPAPAPAPVANIDRAAAMRQAIAAAMTRSKREIPHYYLGTQIDMSAALAWLANENRARPVTERLLPAVMLLKAVALALRDAPELNGFWVDGALRPGSGVHVGVAISLRRGGLVAPAIHDVDRLSLHDLMVALSDLTQRARAGSLRSSEMSDPTITVTSLGDQGVESVFGVIYPPQVALVGFGKTTERPWAIDGLLGVRPVVTASLAADHRASDGHSGGRFLAAIGALLQRPEKL